jgi:hypothetical protein
VKPCSDSSYLTSSRKPKEPPVSYKRQGLSLRKQDAAEIESLVVSTVVSSVARFDFVDEIAVLSAVLAELVALDARLREGGWLVLAWMA